MGNRAVIINQKDMLQDGRINPSQVGVYLHWNGGRDSVEAFLKYCELKCYRTPNYDPYGWANLCKVVGNFFGDGLSLGIGVAAELDCNNHDNGVYIIDGWKIVGRMYTNGTEQDHYKLEEMLEEIDQSMPEREQIGKDYWSAEKVPVYDVNVGDKVIVVDSGIRKGVYEVIGYGKGMVCGHNVTNVPYVDLFGTSDPSANINNYLAHPDYKGLTAKPIYVRRVRDKQE